MQPIQPLTIRTYQDGDRQAVWALHNAALAGTGAHAGNGPWDMDLHEIPVHYLHSGGAFLVGTVIDSMSDNATEHTAERIVAMGALKRLDSTTAAVKRMRVAPDCQRHGYGTAILAALEQTARRLDIRRLVLDTTDLQQAAQRLYTKHGYHETSRGKLGRFNVIYYEKVLT